MKPNCCAIKFRNILLIAFGLIVLATVAGCIKRTLPIGESGFGKFVYRAVNFGYTFDYQIDSYKKRKVTHGVEEGFMLTLAELDHKKMLNFARDGNGWDKIPLTLDRGTAVPTSYAYRLTENQEANYMITQATLFEDSAELKIVFVDIDVTLFFN